MAGEAPLGLKMIFLEDCQVVPDNSVGQTPFHKWRWEKKKEIKNKRQPHKSHPQGKPVSQ